MINFTPLYVIERQRNNCTRQCPYQAHKPAITAKTNNNNFTNFQHGVYCLTTFVTFELFFDLSKVKKKIPILLRYAKIYIL